jgi:hypothetical protein
LQLVSGRLKIVSFYWACIILKTALVGRRVPRSILNSENLIRPNKCHGGEWGLLNEVEKEGEEAKGAV